MSSKRTQVIVCGTRAQADNIERAMMPLAMVKSVMIVQSSRAYIVTIGFFEADWDARPALVHDYDEIIRQAMREVQ